MQAKEYSRRPVQQLDLVERTQVEAIGWRRVEFGNGGSGDGYLCAPGDGSRAFLSQPHERRLLERARFGRTQRNLTSAVNFESHQLELLLLFDARCDSRGFLSLQRCERERGVGLFALGACGGAGGLERGEGRGREAPPPGGRERIATTIRLVVGKAFTLVVVEFGWGGWGLHHSNRIAGLAGLASLGGGGAFLATPARLREGGAAEDAGERSRR